ncbi:hypothetical protein [Pseudonocardia sp. KRD291]|uniref:hypothetical protein n=1 Tax=Pseudonocardia sp. KRD291 TaxID=2792007 RepID=UPI001C4A0ECE|nr:hypothetical protein [Pseudonocardia sp. KRD291]MBW0105916.1 hypothetical protein [Pseudonocardia sp. KRD291]
MLVHTGLVDTLLVDTGVVPAAEASVRVPAQDREPPPGKGPEFGNSSPVGLVVVLLLLIATVVLIRSMSRRIRRLPESFESPEQAPEQADGPAAAGSGDRTDRS